MGDHPNGAIWRIFEITALDNQPLNYNFLPTNNFQFVIKKLPTVFFFCQEANIPSIDLTNTNIPTPFVKMPMYGDHIDYGDMSISFKVDEKMQNYMEIHDWIRKTGFPNNYGEFADIKNKSPASGEGLFSDGELLLFSSAKNPTIGVTFLDMFPVSLSSIQFKSTNEDRVVATCTATFKYREFTIASLVSNA